MKKRKLKTLIGLFSLSVVLGVSAGAVISKNNNAEQTSAQTTQTGVSGIRVYVEDQTGKGWTYSGGHAFLHMYDITFDSNSGFNYSNIPTGSSGTCAFGDNLSKPDSSSLDCKMKRGDNDNKYYVFIPWYITGFNCTFYASTSDRIFYEEGASGAYGISAARGYDYNLYILGSGSGYGPWWDNGVLRAKKSIVTNSNWTYSENEYSVTINSNGGTALSTQNVLHGGKLVNFPTKAGCVFNKYTATNSSSAADVTNNPITSDCTRYAQWSSTTNSTFRLWIWRSTHYATSDYEWKIWNGVDGSSPIAATGYARLNSSSDVYLAYYDLPTNIGYIVPQVFNKAGTYQAGANKGSIGSYVAGSNAYIWYPTSISNGTISMSKNGTCYTISSSAKVDESMLDLVFSAYYTCYNNANNGYKAASQLYKTWIYDSEHSRSNIQGTTTEAQAISAVSSYYIYDYDYSSGSYNYANDQNRNTSTTIYQKWQAMNNMNTNGKVSGVIMPFFNELDSDSSIGIVIISAIVSSLAVAGYFYLKKRKHS